MQDEVANAIQRVAIPTTPATQEYTSRCGIPAARTFIMQHITVVLPQRHPHFPQQLVLLKQVLVPHADDQELVPRQEITASRSTWSVARKIRKSFHATSSDITIE